MLAVVNAPNDAVAVAVATRALAICVAGALLGLGLAALRPSGLQLTHAGGASCEAGAVEPSLLAPDAAASLCAAERALIADVRTDAEFAAGHIANAVHLPCDTRGDVAGAQLAHLADRSLVLVYGTTTADALAVARSIAARLPAGASAKIYALDGGFAAWEKAGLACASGPCEGCGAAQSSPVSR